MIILLLLHNQKKQKMVPLRIQLKQLAMFDSVVARIVNRGISEGLLS